MFWRAFAIALVTGLALALAGPLFAAGGVWFIAGEERVGEALTAYVVIRFLSSPAALVNYAILGYVLGRGEAGLGLLLQILINGVNIAMSIYLGLVLGWGLEGVAWGTVIGEGVGAVAGMAVVGVRFARAARVPAGRLRDIDAFRRMTVVNRDIMIRTFVLVAAYALFTRQGAQLGTEILAANAVLINFLLVAGYFLDGYASAAEQLAGRAVGASWRPAFDRMLRLTAIWGFATSGVLCLFFLVAGDALIGIITTAPEVREAAIRYLPWAAASAVTGVLAFQMDGVFIGATWSRDMRNMMLISLAAYCAALLLLEPVWGNHGLWAAFHVFLLVRGFTMLAVVPPRARETFGT